MKVFLMVWLITGGHLHQIEDRQVVSIEECFDQAKQWLDTAPAELFEDGDTELYASCSITGSGDPA